MIKKKVKSALSSNHFESRQTKLERIKDNFSNGW